MTSSMTMKRHVSTCKNNKTSMSPSLAFRLLLSKAVCMLTGMHPQLCTVFPPMRAAIDSILRCQELEVHAVLPALTVLGSCGAVLY